MGKGQRCIRGVLPSQLHCGRWSLFSFTWGIWKRCDVQPSKLPHRRVREWGNLYSCGSLVEGWFRAVNYPVFSACFALVTKTVVRQEMQVSAAGMSSHVKDQKVLHANIQFWVSDFSGSRGLSCIHIHRTAGPAPRRVLPACSSPGSRDLGIEGPHPATPWQETRRLHGQNCASNSKTLEMTICQRT